MTNIAKGECRGKRKSYFRIGSAEPYPIFYKYRSYFKYNKKSQKTVLISDIFIFYDS